MNRLNLLLHGDPGDVADLLNEADGVTRQELAAALINALRRVAELEARLDAPPVILPIPARPVIEPIPIPPEVLDAFDLERPGPTQCPICGCETGDGSECGACRADARAWKESQS